MKQAHLKDDALLEDIEQACNNQSDALHVWWLGQSGFLVCADGKRLLFDPYLSDSLTKKYANTDKQHVRMTERVIAPERLTKIDAVTSTHNHTDHLDAETLLPLMEANPGMKLVIPEANRAFVAERLECDAGWPVGLADGESAEIAGMTFRAVPAAHEEMERDDEGRCKFIGYVVDIGPWRVYHSGDTIRYEGMEETLQALTPIDLAMLPINGANPERRVAGNLNAQEAAELVHTLRLRRAIPCHYDMFEFNTADPAPFAERCEALGQGYAVLENGERASITSSQKK